ncbi:MAG: HD domain-containing protein [Candidatus Eisenbacteria bacterium]|uniref:HD domain-containing protein n=1 Tax=Eiseniibacteriota bacterium TaxID=2212470 RepID=A0A9D6QJV5_UNCEI|nr:HD domain-containing protein [Candidatus Eisenbacteria bacterium]MBI3539660.1 HD domain-containing protein [Candidatus Eisenbacteria bacterium]
MDAFPTGSRRFSPNPGTSTPSVAEPASAPRLITFESVREHPRVKIYVRKADEALAEIGYTEHGERHVGLVAHIAYNILKRLGHPERDAELAAIAGYLHDIGNAVNRDHHAQTGATMAMQLLHDMGMSDVEIVRVIGAIGNHHENDGDPVSPVAAAVILGDKSDVHRTRVRNPDMIKFDIHDRVNYAVEKSFLNVDEAAKKITLELTVDTAISQVMEYFEIFMTRMLASRKAAKFLGTSFGLSVNGNRLT